MSLVPPNRVTMRTYQCHSVNTTCVDCDATLEFPESLRLSDDKLTAQCTDQCVVIACDDPNHAESMCGGSGPQSHCDFVCDEALDCTDCIGFDAFLQCCSEARPYHAQQTRQDHVEPHQQVSPSSGGLPPNSAVWAAVFEDWCATCGQAESLIRTPNVYENASQASVSSSFSAGSGVDHSANGEMHHSLSLPYQTHLPTGSSTHYSADREMQQQDLQHFQKTNLDPQTSQLPTNLSVSQFNCMWASCQASFPSLSELVDHVNHSHLVSSSSSVANDVGVLNNRAKSPISCLWGNCDNSYYSSSDDFNLFVDHLMNEHLASNVLLHYDQQQQDYLKQHIRQQLGQVQPQQSYEQQPQPVASSSRQLSPAGTQSQSKDVFITDSSPAQMDLDEALSQSSANNHSCTGAHECRWKDCNLSFHSCDDLTTHINDVHIGGGKAHYECFWDQCARNGAQGFQSKQKICRHVQSHTGHRPFQCSICQQNFSEAATLQQHVRRHTQEKPYVCDYPGCGKSFAITGALTIHKRTHNGDKPFKCTYCDRGFAESSNLSKHLRTHTGARPYICAEPGCNKSFARPDQLNRHRGVHKKQIRGVGGQPLAVEE